MLSSRHVLNICFRNKHNLNRLSIQSFLFNHFTTDSDSNNTNKRTKNFKKTSSSLNSPEMVSNTRNRKRSLQTNSVKNGDDVDTTPAVDDDDDDDEVFSTPKKKKKKKTAAEETDARKDATSFKTPNTPRVKLAQDPPKNWAKTLEKIKEMRKDGPLAPVDTMGCEKIADVKDKKTKRYRTLISAMLSSQTKDQINHAAMNRIIERGIDSAEGMLRTEEDDLDQLIIPVGFHRNKARYLRAAAKICLEKYDGDIPETLEGLLELPGVGPKMGHLIMNVGWEKPSGICVDVHVHRITERLGWVDEKCAIRQDGTSPRKRTPEDTRVSLESWLPKEEWVEINPLLVGFGQLTCLPLRPKCDRCAVNALCENAFRDCK
jgi:endonuclease III